MRPAGVMMRRRRKQMSGAMIYVRRIVRLGKLGGIRKRSIGQSNVRSARNTVVSFYKTATALRPQG
jgi:hypothetical protein